MRNLKSLLGCRCHVDASAHSSTANYHTERLVVTKITWLHFKVLVSPALFCQHSSFSWVDCLSQEVKTFINSLTRKGTQWLPTSSRLYMTIHRYSVAYIKQSAPKMDSWRGSIRCYLSPIIKLPGAIYLLQQLYIVPFQSCLLRSADIDS